MCVDQASRRESRDGGQCRGETCSVVTSRLKLELESESGASGQGFAVIMSTLRCWMEDAWRRVGGTASFAFSVQLGVNLRLAVARGSDAPWQPGSDASSESRSTNTARARQEPRQRARAFGLGWKRLSLMFNYFPLSCISVPNALSETSALRVLVSPWAPNQMRGCDLLALFCDTILVSGVRFLHHAGATVLLSARRKTYSRSHRANRNVSPSLSR
eukprot:2278823-Rhodomonas_salina.4